MSLMSRPSVYHKRKKPRGWIHRYAGGVWSLDWRRASQSSRPSTARRVLSLLWLWFLPFKARLRHASPDNFSFKEEEVITVKGFTRNISSCDWRKNGISRSPHESSLPLLVGSLLPDEITGFHLRSVCRWACISEWMTGTGFFTVEGNPRPSGL